MLYIYISIYLSLSLYTYVQIYMYIHIHMLFISMHIGALYAAVSGGRQFEVKPNKSFPWSSAQLAANSIVLISKELERNPPAKDANISRNLEVLCHGRKRRSGNYSPSTLKPDCA